MTLELVLIFGVIVVVGLVARIISRIVINEMKDELNPFQLGLMRWVLPLFVFALIVIVIGLIGGFIKFIVGLL